VSVLTTIIVGLGSGSLGAQLSAWYKARTDRQERFRDRLLDAAEGFSSAASEALVALRDASAAMNRGRPEEIEPAEQRAWVKRDELLHNSARINLLYGPRSEIASLATSVTHELAVGGIHLRSDLSMTDQAIATTTKNLAEFQSTAFARIREAAPPAASIGEVVRRRLPRGRK
jgi:hypothetical protein